MKRFEKHIFVCENVRPQNHPRGCCSEKGSVDLKEYFKKRVRELGLNSNIRINSSGCLDACEFGPSVVIYPEQIWYGDVSLEDAEEIIQMHLILDRPVERLLIRDKRFNRDAKE